MLAFFKSYHLPIKQNIKIALPVSFSQLGHIIVSVVDTIMAGQLGAIPLAAATIATSVFMPFLMFLIGMTYGITTMVAQLDGAKKTKRLSLYFSQSVVLYLTIAILLTVLLFFSSYIFKHLNQADSIIIPAQNFAQILSFSMIPLVLFQILKQFIEGFGDTKMATTISMLTNVVNIFLVIMLSQGLWIFPNWGFEGIAWATLIARCLMFLALLIYVLNQPHYIPYIQWWPKKIYRNVMKKTFMISLPIGVQLFLEAGAFGFAAIMVGWIGTVEVAAHQIALNLAAVSYMAATGIASAATVRVGNAFGKKDYHEMDKAGNAAMMVSMLFMSICALLFILFKTELALVYIKDMEIVELAALLLVIAAWFQLSDGAQVVSLGALRGIGDVKIPTLFVILAYWVIGLPLGGYLAFNRQMGAQGVWYGLLIGLTIVAISLFWRFKMFVFRFIKMKENE